MKYWMNGDRCQKTSLMSAQPGCFNILHVHVYINAVYSVLWFIPPPLPPSPTFVNLNRWCLSVTYIYNVYIPTKKSQIWYPQTCNLHNSIQNVNACICQRAASTIQHTMYYDNWYFRFFLYLLSLLRSCFRFFI